MNMEDAFLLNEEERANFLRLLMQSFGCTYICLWSYLPQPPNFLLFLDGYYNEENNQLARNFFDQYRQIPFNVENNRVPGFAFRNNLPYIELKQLDLQGMASVEAQRRFYQEANIQTAVFMGCKRGEIELGWSNVTQINVQMEMRNWFPEDFSQPSTQLGEPSQPVDPNRPSSSSSSLKSLDSPDSSSLLFNIPITSQIPETLTEAPPLLPISTSSSPHQQAMQAFARIRNIQLPSPESEDAAMTRAILAVLTSPSSSSSSSSRQVQQTLPYRSPLGPNASAFKKYASASSPPTPVGDSLRRQSMLKESITYYRSLNIWRRQHMLASRPTSTQLHHMISERKRREKLNESFNALRSLLPPETKKDKASVLTRTREYLSSLKEQVEKLSRRNQQLEAQLAPVKEAAADVASGSSNDRLNVRVTPEAESTSSEHIVNLQVTIRGECPILDMVIRILEFLKRVQNVNVISLEANSLVAESEPFGRINLRLRIEGNEWDGPAFQEAVRRVVADLALRPPDHSQP